MKDFLLCFTLGLTVSLALADSFDVVRSMKPILKDNGNLLDKIFCQVTKQDDEGKRCYIPDQDDLSLIIEPLTQISLKSFRVDSAKDVIDAIEFTRVVTYNINLDYATEDDLSRLKQARSLLEDTQDYLTETNHVDDLIQIYPNVTSGYILPCREDTYDLLDDVEDYLKDNDHGLFWGLYVLFSAIGAALLAAVVIITLVCCCGVTISVSCCLACCSRRQKQTKQENVPHYDIHPPQVLVQVISPDATNNPPPPYTVKY